MPKLKLTEKEVIKLINLYKNPSIPMSKLCTMFKVSDDTIVRVMKRNKIPMRVTVGFNGNKNSNWKGGYSLRYAKNLAIRHIGKNACVYCGYTTLTDVHHWDGNNKNNKPENLVLLCPNHHREVHVGLLAKEKILNRPRRGGEVPRESHKLQTPVQFRAALRKAA